MTNYQYEQREQKKNLVIMGILSVIFFGFLLLMAGLSREWDTQDGSVPSLHQQYDSAVESIKRTK